MIEKRQYENEEGANVIGKYPVNEDGSAKLLAKPEFSGVVGIDTQMGRMPINFDFPEEYSLKECFDNFEEVAEVEVNRIIKEAKEQAAEDNLIATPDGAGAGAGAPNLSLVT